MKRIFQLAAFALPVIGLGALWGMSEYESRQGTFWEVPVAGYDPRDLLRGHYVEFTYDWAGLEEGLERGLADRGHPNRICISQGADGLTKARRVEGEFGDCAYPAEADASSVYGGRSLMRGRLYVGQDRAQELERTMRDRDMRAIVKIRLGENRRITPLDITLRPLTEAERAARDADDAGDAGDDVVADVAP